MALYDLIEKNVLHKRIFLYAMKFKNLSFYRAYFQFCLTILSMDSEISSESIMLKKNAKRMGMELGDKNGYA